MIIAEHKITTTKVFQLINAAFMLMSMMKNIPNIFFVCLLVCLTQFRIRVVSVIIVLFLMFFHVVFIG